MKAPFTDFLPDLMNAFSSSVTKNYPRSTPFFMVKSYFSNSKRLSFILRYDSILMLSMFYFENDSGEIHVCRRNIPVAEQT